MPDTSRRKSTTGASMSNLKEAQEQFEKDLERLQDSAEALLSADVMVPTWELEYIHLQMTTTTKTNIMTLINITWTVAARVIERYCISGLAIKKAFIKVALQCEEVEIEIPRSLGLFFVSISQPQEKSMAQTIIAQS